MTVRILLVEDQAIVRNGLKMILEQDEALSVVAEASNGIEALTLLEQQSIDLVLLDIRMPEMNGIEATQHIRSRFPALKILILTTFDDEEYAYQTLKDGANGFLVKSSEPKKLIASIHSVFAGGMVLQEEVAAKLVPKLLQQTIKQEEPSTNLTARELEIARFIGEGKTNKEIAQELFLSVGTVKNHITHILNELQLRDRTQLAIYAVRNGLV